MSSTCFADSFWDEQYKGVDIVFSRLRKSKDTCEQIKRLYELRASIEQDYGEKLLKLAQSLRIGEFEENTFAETLSRIPSIFETTARAHIDLAQQLKDHLESPLDGFLKDQRDIRKAEQQKIENSKQLQTLHESDVTRTKDYYSNECKKLTSLEKSLFDLIEEYNKDNNQDILQNIYKIEKEIEEQKRMLTVADQMYQRSIENLNKMNEKWINDWTTSANQFQEMEVKRITYTRDTLWSFSNMMTTTLNIDEECCDRIRTALEITDVDKDMKAFVKHYGTGSTIPVPSTYKVLYHPTQIHIPSLLKTIDESMQHKDPITTIHTNPDEELKSVDRQLKQLEIQECRSDMDHQPSSGHTDHSNGNFNTAFKEIESMLNQNNHDPPKVTTNFSASSSNALETPHLDPSRPSFEKDEKFKPMPNPNFNHPMPVVGSASSSSSILKSDPIKSDENGDEDEDEQQYHQRMPRPPPKDEKWMISSIRRPQQLPVRTLNAKISSTHSSVISPLLDHTVKAEEEPYHPKAHRPPIPLSIDIPNAIPKQQNNPQNAAQQVIAEGRRLSQMSPVPQKLELQPQQIRYQQQQNPVEDGGIRPAPWREEFNTDDQMVQPGYYNGYHPSSGYAPGPRGSSLKLANQQEQHYQQQEQKEEKKLFGGKKPVEPKPNKEKSRFSNIFFNKKDKKKEKQKESTLGESFTSSRPVSQQFQSKQPSLQDMDRKSNHSESQQRLSPLVQQPPLLQQQQPPPPHVDSNNRFIGFAKAQWPFEANIEGEMSFDMHEVLGIYRRQADGWWEAERLHTGQRGLVPGNYMVDAPPPSS